MMVRYDPDVDALYVMLADAPVEYTDDVSLGQFYERGIDYASDGSVRGYEFLNVSRGVNLDGLPHQDALMELFERVRGIPVLSGTG
ncbi:MAG: DUF2283 domain-containing protein [Chloroflexota bacterium]